LAINHDFLKTGFFSQDFSQVPCPNCQKNLHLDEKTVAHGETADSAENSRFDGHDVDLWEGRFSCLLRCANCFEAVAVAGRCGLELWGNGEGGHEEEMVFYPMFFQNAPHIFSIPEEVPAEVAAEVKKAFELYWSDASASGNRIRTSIEMLLTHLKVKRFTINSRGKREVVSLNNRIAILQSRRPNLSQEFIDALTAIRHLGNAGSHPAGLTKDDVLDAMKILDHILQEIFVQHGRKVAQITHEINRRKGPRSK